MKENTEWIIHERLRRNRVIAKNWNSLFFIRRVSVHLPNFPHDEYEPADLCQTKNCSMGQQLNSFRFVHVSDAIILLLLLFFFLCSCCCASKMYTNCARFWKSHCKFARQTIIRRYKLIYTFFRLVLLLLFAETSIHLTCVDDECERSIEQTKVRPYHQNRLQQH